MLYIIWQTVNQNNAAVGADIVREMCSAAGSAEVTLFRFDAKSSETTSKNDSSR